MKFFKKSKRETSCCNVQFEEVKNENPQKKNNSCCDVKIEEVKPEKDKNKTTGGCCG